MKKDLPAKISLGYAAEIISRSIEALNQKEDGYEEQFNMVISSYIDDATLSLNESIDRRKYLVKESKSKIELARVYKKELNRQIKKYKKIYQSIIESTKNIVLENPSVKFSDSFGKKVFVSNSGVEKIDIKTQYRKKIVDYVLSRDTINSLKEKGYGEYVTEEKFFVLDVDKIFADLKSGKSIEFASIYVNKLLKGLR